MEANQASKTALGTAFMRAYHAQHDSQLIFNDFIAKDMIPDEIRQDMEHRFSQLAKLTDPERAASCSDHMAALDLVMRTLVIPPIILARARYTEDHLAGAVNQGVRQYVILGAGMDSYAFRYPQMAERLQIFEIDHPATQGFKRQQLANLSWKEPGHLHFIGLDFEQGSLVEALRQSGYDRELPSFFSWLGVTYYLTREAALDTLRAIADVAPAGSVIVFDYMDEDVFNPPRTSKRLEILHAFCREVNEPLLTGFAPDTLAVDLAQLGFRLQEDLDPQDIQKRYFLGRTDGYYAGEHVHFARAVHL